jgi:type IV secretion system protein TrbL
MPQDVGVLTWLLHQFLAVLTPAYGRLLPHSEWLFGMLVGIEALLLIVWWLLGAGAVLPRAVGFLLHTGLFLWLLRDYADIITRILHSFVQLGLLAGGNTIPVETFLNPSAIANFGIVAAQPIAQRLGTYGIWSVLTAVHLPDLLLYGVAWLLIVGAFFIAAILVFITVVSFTVVTIGGLAFLPFVASRHTSFLAQGPISLVFSTAARLFTLALLTSVAYPLMERLILPPAPTLPHAWAAVLGSGGLAALYWQVPGLAASLASGIPSLAMGAVMAPAVSGAAIATQAASQGARMAVGGAQQLTRAVTAGRTAMQQGGRRAVPAAVGSVMAQTAIGRGFRAAVQAGRVAGSTWSTRQGGGRAGGGRTPPSGMGRTSVRQPQGGQP